MNVDKTSKKCHKCKTFCETLLFRSYLFNDLPVFVSLSLTGMLSKTVKCSRIRELFFSGGER